MASISVLPEQLLTRGNFHKIKEHHYHSVGFSLRLFLRPKLWLPCHLPGALLRRVYFTPKSRNDAKTRQRSVSLKINAALFLRRRRPIWGSRAHTHAIN